MTRIVRIERRPDTDALVAREVLTVSGILALALGLLALIHRLG